MASSPSLLHYQKHRDAASRMASPQDTDTYLRVGNELLYAGLHDGPPGAVDQQRAQSGVLIDG